MRINAAKRMQASLSLLLVFSMLLAACDSAGSGTPTAAPVPATMTGTVATAVAAASTATAAPPAPSPSLAASPTSMAASSPTAAASANEPIYVAVIWHQHQPFYFKDPTSGVYEKPWVRMHSIKDYLDMVTMLDKYPNAHVTINLTPSLIKQIDDFTQNGARDQYFVVAAKAAGTLSDADKKFMLQRFFDTNSKIINRFPRYAALQTLRGSDTSDAALASAAAKFQEQEWRDLQTWFNLAWFDPDLQSQEPLKALISKGQGFSEQEKQQVLDYSIEIMKKVIPAHKAAMERGQVEVITTPYAHPILPLIYDTDSARIALGGSVPLPDPKFSYPQDAAAQVELGKQIYHDHFGRDPQGMWPAEGSVSQDVVKLFADAGVSWIATDEKVLASSFAIENGIERDGTETVKLPQFLYTGYTVKDSAADAKPVNIVFRDHLISDKIGFDYSGQSGDSASSDLLNRVHNAQKALAANPANAGQPHLVTILLDGENAWENYDNDGKDFLNGMYSKLSNDPNIKMVTPSEYFKQFPNGRAIKKLYAGSWIDGTYSTWIGEGEENLGWNYLRQTREMFDQYLTGKKPIDPAKLEAAKLQMYSAEGSDWFWWFGNDQSSGNDDAFDDQFRKTLGQVYALVGEQAPAFLNVPIVARLAPAPQKAVSGDISPTIDGKADAGEWDKAGSYTESGGGAMSSGGQVVAASYYGSDAKNLYVRVDATKPWTANATFGLYLDNPHMPSGLGFSRNGAKAASPQPLGFLANYLAEATLSEGKLTASGIYSPTAGAWGTSSFGTLQAAAQGNTFELALPWAELGDLKTGDNINFIVVVSDSGSDIAAAPGAGAVAYNVPDRNPLQVVLQVDDPLKDDHGPGSYTYPQNAAFSPGNFDFKQFIVGTDSDDNMVFRFVMNGAVPNPWGSSSGLAVQTFDVYVDTDHKDGSGARRLFPGRNAAVPSADAWDVAFRAEGWPDGQGVYKGEAAKDPPTKIGELGKIQVDAGQRTVTIRIPRKDFPSGDPSTWGYLAVVLSQDGTNSARWRTRTVGTTAAEWVVGGGTGATNDPGILDVAYPADFTPKQEDALKSFKPSTSADLTKVAPDDFAQLPMVRKK